MLISLACSAGLFWVFRRANRQKKNVALALDLSFILMISALVGARLSHVLYEAMPYYRENPIDIFKLWQGGFVYYGGFILALICATIYLKFKRESFWLWADFFAPVVSLTYAIGRLGCLLAGCCYGKLCTLPWAIEFHYTGLPTGGRHPTALYAVLWELFVLIMILLIEKRKTFAQNGQLFLIWLGAHALGRMIMELFRDDYRGPEILGLSVSTHVSIVIILISFIYFFWQTRTSRRSQN